VGLQSKFSPVKSSLTGVVATISSAMLPTRPCKPSRTVFACWLATRFSGATRTLQRPKPSLGTGQSPLYVLPWSPELTRGRPRSASTSTALGNRRPRVLPTLTAQTASGPKSSSLPAGTVRTSTQPTTSPTWRTPMASTMACARPHTLTTSSPSSTRSTSTSRHSTI